MKDGLRELAALAQLFGLLKELKAQRKEVAELRRRIAALVGGG